MALERRGRSHARTCRWVSGFLGRDRDRGICQAQFNWELLWRTRIFSFKLIEKARTPHVPAVFEELSVCVQLSACYAWLLVLPVLFRSGMPRIFEDSSHLLLPAAACARRARAALSLPGCLHAASACHSASLASKTGRVEWWSRYHCRERRI